MGAKRFSLARGKTAQGVPFKMLLIRPSMSTGTPDIQAQ